MDKLDEIKLIQFKSPDFLNDCRYKLTNCWMYLDNPGETKVSNFYVVSFTDEDVASSKVSVNVVL